MLKIYLGGQMTGLSFTEMNEWRKIVKELLFEEAMYCGKKIEVINPVDYYNFQEIRHQSESEVMNFDLRKVSKCDVLVINLHGLNKSIGTIIECYEAYKMGIPVLVFGSLDDYEILHPWVKCCITRRDENIFTCVRYIREFYIK